VVALFMQPKFADGQTKTVTDGWLADQGPLRHYDTWRNKGSLGTLMQIIK